MSARSSEQSSLRHPVERAWNIVHLLGALCSAHLCILRLPPVFCQHVVAHADFFPAYAGERHADVIGDAVVNCSTNEACTRPGPSFLAVSHE